MKKILLSGGIVVEQQYFVDTIPGAGEFALSQEVRTAVTSKVINGGRLLSLGFNTHFLGTVGKDTNGQLALKALEEFAFKTNLVKKTDKHRTGTVVVITNKNGESSITVNLAANLLTKAIKIDKFDAIYTATSLPLDTLYQLVSQKQPDQILLLDVPNKHQQLDLGKLDQVDFFIPNRHETELILKRKIVTPKDALQAAKAFFQIIPTNIIITLDKDGCVIVNNNLQEHLDPLSANPIDTTAAGDIFRGVFLNSYLHHPRKIIDALEKAVKISAKSTEIQGVDKSIEVAHELLMKK